MLETKACPVCGKPLSVSDCIHELTVVHGWSLRDAKRWAGLNLGILGQGAAP